MADMKGAFEKVGIVSAQTETEKSERDNLKIPKDYVAEAEKVMYEISTPDYKDNEKRRFEITTSKIRNMLSLVMDIYNVERLNQNEELTEESKKQIQLMRIRILYESGRDNKVSNFIKRAKIIEYIKGIGSNKERFIEFTHYMEALVAYHRFFGGRD